MKKLMTFLAFSTGVLCSTAQITLTSSNTPRPADAEIYRITNDSGIDVPIEGANITYNYSNLPNSTGNENTFYYPPTRTGYTGFTTFINAQTVIGGAPLNQEHYYDYNSTGLFAVANYMSHHNIDLNAITGGSNDSIVFPEFENFFSIQAPILTFPFTYGDVITSNKNYNTDFEITVAAYNLQQTPGSFSQRVSETIEGAGYGKITLPMNGGNSIAYDVIMVKFQSMVIDSVFLAGSPAPPPLLSAFGLVQGDTTYTNFYKFYAEDFESTILTITMDETWTNAVLASYDTSALTLDTGLGLIENEFSETLNIYPNPASDKITVTFDANDASAKQVAIYDLSGKELKAINTNTMNTSSDKLEIDLQNLSNGTYFVKVSSDINSATKKIVINK